MTVTITLTVLLCLLCIEVGFLAGSIFESRRWRKHVVEINREWAATVHEIASRASSIVDDCSDLISQVFASKKIK